MRDCSDLVVQSPPARFGGGRHRPRPAPETAGEATERRRLEQELRHTLSQDGFVLHYQPFIELRSGAMVGGEALIRWPHRKRGMVAPGLFLPIADRSALGTHIGGWVLRTACAEAATWPGGAIVTVNVSPRHLFDGALLEHVAEAVQISGLAPERLELELPEPALLDVDVDTLFTLSALRDRGIGLVFDNFGAGYGSLSVLRRLPLTGVKLDRSFVRSVPADPEAAAIVLALANSAHALGLQVIASGIESESQREFLAAIGCDLGQGHLFSQALTSSELATRLRP